MIDLTSPLALDPERQKERTLEVLLGQLAGLAAHRPVLELFEDVHWADPTTLELLDCGRLVHDPASLMRACWPW